jgi:predicted enzyme related to lactoylglutathione lyase
MRFNHMELTFARGTLTDAFREEVDAFYGSVFGWKATDADVVGQSCHILLPDDDQFILLAESGKPMSSPGFDHLGLLQDTRAEVDDLLEACKRYQDKDDRVQIQEYEDLKYPQLTVHAFYVKHLLPIYFDVQSMEHSS